MAEIVEKLKAAMRDYNAEEGEAWVKKGLTEGLDPVFLLEIVTSILQEVGDGFGQGNLFLPDLVAIAETTKRILPVLEESIISRGGKVKSRGTIVAGTVRGDVHSIGIGMVVALSRAAGFTVIDLGIDVTLEKFINAIKEYNPDILAMSALLTTTAPFQKKVIDALKEANMRDKIKIAIGGGAISQEFADSIGADGFRATAPLAVELFKEFVKKGD